MSVCARRFPGRRFNAYFSLSLLFVLAAVLTGLGLGYSITRQAAPAPSAAVTAKTTVLQDSEWLSEGYWRKRKRKKLRNRTNAVRSNQYALNPFAPNFGSRSSPWQYGGGAGTYRTVCVRLCDGYYFPISYSTTRSRLGVDERACRSRCSGDSRLFYYRNSGGSPETMVDRRGNAYADLKTAFLYRTSYNKSCQCRPEPWSNEARQRHAMYATKAWQRRSRRLAKLENRRKRRNRRVVTGYQPSSTLFSAAVRGYDQQDPVTGQHLQSLDGLTASNLDSASPRRKYSRSRMGLGRNLRNVKQARSRPRTVRRTRKRWRSKILFGNNN